MSQAGSSAIMAMVLGAIANQEGMFNGSLTGPGRRIPVVTLSLAAVTHLIHYHMPQISRLLAPLDISIDVTSSALIPSEMIKRPSLAWRRVLLATLHHVNQVHLFCNLSSLLVRGKELEGRFGSVKFAGMCIGLTIVSHVTMVGISYTLAQFPRTARFSNFNDMTIGMSCLLFGLGIVSNCAPQKASYQSVGGLMIPTTHLGTLLELVVAQFILPNVSLIGHIGGIIAGLICVDVVRPYGGAGTGEKNSVMKYVAPVLAGAALLWSPLRWMQTRRAITRAKKEEDDRAAAAAIARGAFVHNPNGYQLGRSSSSSSLPSSSSSQLRHSAASNSPAATVAPTAASPQPPQSSQSSISSAPAVQYFEPEMANLYAMGFHERKANLAALRTTKGDVQRAKDLLTRQQSPRAR